MSEQAYAGLLERLRKPLVYGRIIAPEIRRELEFADREKAEAAEAISSLLKALERTQVIALEQRCQRGTPWDRACVHIATKLRVHIDAALNSDAPADKPRVCKRCGTPEGEPHRFRHIPKYAEVPDNSDAPLSIGEGL